MWEENNRFKTFRVLTEEWWAMAARCLGFGNLWHVGRFSPRRSLPLRRCRSVKSIRAGRTESTGCSFTRNDFNISDGLEGIYLYPKEWMVRLSCIFGPSVICIFSKMNKSRCKREAAYSVLP